MKDADIPDAANNGALAIEDIESLLGLTTPLVAAAIDRALTGQDLSIEDAVTLFDCTGTDM